MKTRTAYNNQIKKTSIHLACDERQTLRNCAIFIKGRIEGIRSVGRRKNAGTQNHPMKSFEP